MTSEERSALLHFCAGSASVPAASSGTLMRYSGQQQRFWLQRTEGGSERLPTAPTCFSTLRLPGVYPAKRHFRSRCDMQCKRHMALGMVLWLKSDWAHGTISEIGHLRASRMVEPDKMFAQTKRATVPTSRDRYDQPESDSFFRHAIICAHPEQTVSYDLFSQTL